MHTIAYKPKATQQTKSASSSKFSQILSRQSYEADLMCLQRTIGNQAVQRMLKANIEELEVDSDVTSSTRFAPDFSQLPLSAKTPGRIQLKRRVGTPEDIYERDANRIAEKVKRMPEPQQQHTCAYGGGCPKCKKADQSPGQTLSQTKLTQANNSAETDAPPIVDEVLSQPGYLLDASVRDFMERHFGADLSRVRLHTGSLAAKSAKAVNARAFKFGNDIIFGAAQYVPNSKATQSLLAPELSPVVQQRQPGSASYGKMPSIQRQSDGSDEAGPQRGGADAQGAQLRREYIEVACEVIADIRAAVEGGRTWYFEDELLLQGEEWLRVNQQTLVDERREALQELIRGLDEIIQELDAGGLLPPDPASRSALADLWEARNPRAIQALAERWTPVFAHRRLPSGALEAHYPALSSYIVTQAGSPPGMLHAASFPTWWVLGCHRIQQPEQPLPPGGRVTPTELGLPQDSVVYLSGLNNDQWDWEPRGGPYPEALGPTYDWHYDQSAGRVFIVVGTQQLNLLRDRRVEIQR